ncbi:hypothetical protein MVEN_00206900 [Mycena venus]|uniref:Uncharacterized protein n=1 Tax=Mycena venus TaxID=2733690 RepID=A0A8H7DDC7_9AGAR|nr:hypothetical protein MVEN_00206900 [Mycena venus]
MKLFNSLLVSATIAASTLGKTIGSPAKGTTVKAGSNITVQVNGARVNQSTIEAAVVIGLLSCSPPCPPPGEQLGKILYNGPYFPFIHLVGIGPFGTRIYQNLTVTIPADTPAGPAQLSVTQANFLNDQSHLVLISDEVLVSVE